MEPSAVQRERRKALQGQGLTAPNTAVSAMARPLTSVDVVIFSVRDGVLSVLLVQRPGGADEPFPKLWALPGGFVDIDQDASLLDCALRKLHEKTGVSSPYLEQLGSWGDAQRDPRGWSTTHVYFALIASGDQALQAGGNAADAQWVAADTAPTLAFDHSQILCRALERLRAKVEYTSLPAYLLPEPFTLPQLQAVYEAVLGRPLDKSGFRTRMLSAGFLREVGLMPDATRRPPMGYQLADRSAATFFTRTFNARSESGAEPTR
jgi:8-oxo-dGTP diphosphatase